MVHVRRLDDQTLTFIVSGKLWRNSLVMQDVETGSLWSHITGECLDGAYQGRTLEQIPSVQTTWSAWHDAHPNSRVLQKSEEVLSSRYEHYFADQQKAGLFRTRWLHERMPAKAIIHGVTNGVHAAAVTDVGLESGSVRVFDLGGLQVAVSRDEAGGVRAEQQPTGEELVVRTAFWFAWSSFYPNTLVVD